MEEAFFSNKFTPYEYKRYHPFLIYYLNKYIRIIEKAYEIK